jgi:hypothetical protein
METRFEFKTFCSNIMLYHYLFQKFKLIGNVESNHLIIIILTLPFYQPDMMDLLLRRIRSCQLSQAKPVYSSQTFYLSSTFESSFIVKSSTNQL